MKRCFIVLLAMLAGSILPVTLSAQAPNNITYQGRLTDALGNPLASQSPVVKFAIYNVQSSGTPLWSEVNTVQTDKDGLFSIVLAQTTPFPPLLFTNTNLHLGITVSSDPEMSPRTMLQSVPYAMCVATVSANEMTNEPGLSANSNSTAYTLTGAMQDLVTTTITIPAAGHIVIDGKVGGDIVGSTASGYGYVQIDESSGGTFEAPYYTIFGMNQRPNTLAYYFPVYCQRVYYKAAGSYTFRLEAFGSYSGGQVHCYSPMIVARYYPTSYGSVSSALSSDKAERFPITERTISVDPLSGAVHESKKVDLRDLELRAAKAEGEAERLRRQLLEEKLKQQGGSNK